jgi:hypothetical protein
MRRRTLTPRSLLLAGAMIVLPGVAVALCIAVVNTAITTNGIVVSPPVVHPPATCQGDAGWAGVVGQPFSPPDGVALGDAVKQPRIFLAAFGTPATKFYVGVHVPFDPQVDRNDRLTLYFDANNDNKLGLGDFALLYEVGPTTPIVAGQDCNQTPGQVQIYHHNGTNWGAPSLITPADGVTSMFSYDDDRPTSDPEKYIWELEIELDAATLGLAPAGFKIGAKLYPNEAEGSAGLGQTWMWPEHLTDVGDPSFYYPDDGNVTVAKLRQLELTACADLTIDDISATSPEGPENNNKFRRPLPGDWHGGVLPANLRNQFSASVRFFNPSDPTDVSPVPVANTGNVVFTIRPWGGGNFLGAQIMNTTTLSFTHLSQVLHVPTFGWPVNYTADYQPIEALMNASGHSCLKVELAGFPVNIDPAGDTKFRNLTYTTMSTRTDTFLVTTRTPELREARGEIEIILRAKWMNLPDNFASGWKYSVVNAAALGMTDLGNGYYRFVMAPGQERQVILQMSGGDMPVKPQQLTLDPKAGGTVLNPSDGLPPLTVPVKQGQVVSVVAQGQIRVLTDSLFNGANGRSDRERSKLRFLLGSRIYSGFDHIGAVIGSFDGFKSGFVVGADRSFVVPPGATQLSLAVNDAADEYANNRDGAFTLYLFITDPRGLPTEYTAPANPALGQPALLAPATSIPQLNVDLFRAVPLQPHASQPPPPPDARWLQPLSYVAYAVYQTHVKTPPPPGGCAPKTPAGAALLVGTSALGIILVRRRPGPRRRKK